MKKVSNKDEKWALHAIIINKRIPLDQAKETAQNFIKNEDKKFYRIAKNTYRFRNYPKQNFNKFRTVKINPDISTVYGRLKKDKEHLQGGFITDLIENVKSFFSIRYDFNNISKKVLETYGNNKIKSLEIYRTPISNLLSGAINLLSLGKFEMLKNIYGYDKLFHIAIVATMEPDYRKIIIEKNEVINISYNYNTTEFTEVYPVDLLGKKISLEQLVYEPIDKVGKTIYFSYDPFNNELDGTNCQGYIRLLLKTQGLYNDKINAFLFQPLENIYARLPKFVQKLSRFTTDVAAWVNKILGRGIGMTDDEIVNYSYNMIHNMLQDDKYKKLLVDLMKQNHNNSLKPI